MSDSTVFRGLRPYQKSDSAFFVGRESEIRRLLDVLAEQSLVFLVGDSGSGKTSLINAGVLPTLQRPPQTAYSPQLIMRPRNSPLSAFAEALTGRNPAETEQIYTSLKSDPRAVVEVLNQKGCSAERKALLVVDQFEEIYAVAQATEASCFLDAILAGHEAHLLAIIISIRSDYVANIAQDTRLLRRLSGSTVVLGPPTESEMRRAIEQPAAAAGVSFEPGLVDRIINDIQVAGVRGSLPVLQLLMHSLWERKRSDVITYSDYAEIGSVEGALTGFLEHNWQRFDDTDQARLRRIVPRLVTTQGARQLVSLDEFDAADRRLIDQLVNARLVAVTTDRGDGHVYAELTHDYLVAALSRLLGTLDAEQKRRSTSLSRLAGAFGFKTMEKQLDDRSREFDQAQVDYDKLMSDFATLNAKKAHLERQFEELQMEIQKDTPKVFLSYVREDEEIVFNLYRNLKDQGLQPWLDKVDLMTGVEWDRAIRKAIRESDFIVVCISSRTRVKRGYIQRELRQALDCYEELPPGDAFLMPVRLEECEVPEDLLKYQYTDLFDDDGFDRLVKSILSHWAKRDRS